MPTVVVPSGVYLRCIYQLDGVDWAINVYGVQNPTHVAIDQALANTVGAAVKGFFTSSGWASHVNDHVTLHRVGMRDLSIANQLEYIDSAAAVSGSDPSSILPLQTALTVTLRTALAGKSYRGRSYLFGCTEASNIDGGVIFPATRTSAVAWVNGIGSALSSHALELAVVSQTLHIATPVAQVVSRDANWTSQRRRRSGI